MQNPLVSVIIPAHNGADLIAEAIRSVLDQAYPHLELLVVDDGSSDGTSDVVRQFTDARVKCLSHPRARGACAARATGLRESRGEIVAFLDQDDVFHREKLAVHAEFLGQHPGVGFTYNPFFILGHPSGHRLGIFRPPDVIRLEDLVLGYPVPPSAWVVRRQWVEREELWDPDTFHRGREIVFCGRLFVAGCRFAMVDRALHSRRLEVGRRFANPAANCREERLCQQIMLDDPRCPAAVRALRDTAYGNTDLVWAYVALAQGDTPTGQELLRRAVALAPGLLEDAGHGLIEFLLHHVAMDTDDPAPRLRSVLGRFPPELHAIAGHADAIVGEAHLVKAAQHALWDRVPMARPHLARASAVGARVTRSFLERLCCELLACEAEFGARAASRAIRRVGSTFEGHGHADATRTLRGAYHLSRAFQSHWTGQPRRVPGRVLKAFAGDPSTLANRGAWSILVRSIARGGRRAVSTRATRRVREG